MDYMADGLYGRKKPILGQFFKTMIYMAGHISHNPLYYLANFLLRIFLCLFLVFVQKVEAKSGEISKVLSKTIELNEFDVLFCENLKTSNRPIKRDIPLFEIGGKRRIKRGSN